MNALELVPEAHRSEFELALQKQDLIDAQQLLSDLGYLNREAYDEGTITADQLTNAIALFRQECQVSLVHDYSKDFTALWKQLKVVSPANTDQALSPSEVLFLKSVMGLEGELVFDKMPDQVEVCYRLAHYRFRVYGLIGNALYPDPAQLKNQKALFTAAMQQLKFEDSIVDFLNVLGDQNLLSDFCKNSEFIQKGFIGPVFFFDVKSMNARDFNKITGERIKLTKSKDFLSSITNDKLKATLERVLDDGNKEFIQQYITSQENQFLLRVMQVKLWVFGLYQGELDYDFGPQSVTALMQFIQIAFQETSEDDESLKKILHVINDDQCLINFQYMLDKYVLKFEEQDEERISSGNEYFSIITGEFDTDDEEVNAARQDLVNNVESSLITHTQELVELKKPRRLYKGKNGIRRFLSRVVNFVKGVANKLVGVIKKLIQFLEDTIKYIFEEIKEAFDTFQQGLSFLFGKREVTTNNLILSNYDFDFDGYTILKTGYTNEDLSSHSSDVISRAEALYPTIRFVTEVISWGVKLATGVAWVEVLAGMAKLLKKLIAK